MLDNLYKKMSDPSVTVFSIFHIHKIISENTQHSDIAEYLYCLYLLLGLIISATESVYVYTINPTLFRV